MWKKMLRINVSPPRIPIYIWNDSKFPLNAVDEIGIIGFKSFFFLFDITIYNLFF